MEDIPYKREYLIPPAQRESFQSLHNVFIITGPPRLQQILHRIHHGVIEPLIPKFEYCIINRSILIG